MKTETKSILPLKRARKSEKALLIISLGGLFQQKYAIKGEDGAMIAPVENCLSHFSHCPLT